jgi:hypothetical protein
MTSLSNLKRAYDTADPTQRDQLALANFPDVLARCLELMEWRTGMDEAERPDGMPSLAEVDKWIDWFIERWRELGWNDADEIRADVIPLFRELAKYSEGIEPQAAQLGRENIYIVRLKNGHTTMGYRFSEDAWDSGNWHCLVPADEIARVFPLPPQKEHIA